MTCFVTTLPSPNACYLPTANGVANSCRAFLLVPGTVNNEDLLMFKTLFAFIEHALAMLLGSRSAPSRVQYFQVEQDYFAADQAEQAVALFTETYGKPPRFVDSVHPWTLLKGRNSTGMPVELPLNEVLRQSLRSSDRQLPHAVHLTLNVDM